MKSHRDAGRLKFASSPLVLPHADIRRLLDKQPRLLILSRELVADAYEVHDAKVIRDNTRHVRSGRDDRVTDPYVLVLELTDVEQRPLLDLDPMTVNQAGFETLEDFYLEWLRRRHQIVLSLTVKLYTFRVAEEALYLHKRVQRGYTRNPSLAAHGEHEVVDAAHLTRFATDATERYAAAHAEDLARRDAKSLAKQLQGATSRAVAKGLDVTPEMMAIREQLDQINSKLEAA